MGDINIKFKATTKLKISDNKYVSGRDDELKAIQRFINSHIERGGSLLIFGPCGSGKTVCILHILSLNLVPNYHYITCYKFTRISDFFKKLISIVSDDTAVIKTEKDLDTRRFVISCLSQFKMLVSKLKRPILIVLDEIDFIHQLCGQNSIFGSRDFIIQELFTIVNNNQKIILIAISNNLELASYICGTKFSRLPFKPYNEEQLLSIITSKLGDYQVINKTALKVVTRRIVNSSSDCRKCLDVFSRALSEHLYSNTNNNTISKDYKNENYEMGIDDKNEFVTPKRSRTTLEEYNNTNYTPTDFASEIGIHEICTSTPTLSIGSRDSLDLKIQTIPTIHQIVLYSMVQLALDYMEEIPYRSISLSAKHVMKELHLNESYQLSVDGSLEHLEALGIIERKDDIVLIKPELNALVKTFESIDLFNNLNVSRVKDDFTNPKVYIKRPWWRRK